MARKVLNVGGNSREIAIPRQYSGFEHVLLDIDPSGEPDIVCDARELALLDPGGFDAVYCSHNLEHYFRHDVARVLAGFVHVLKPDGFAHIRVPDIGALMRRVAEEDLDVEDMLYESPAGPIAVLDVLYGYGRKIEESGEDYYAHKTGFTVRSLERALRRAGFTHVYRGSSNLEIVAVAFLGEPGEFARSLFRLG